MSMNILVVDDEKEIADVIELYLQNDQYNVYKLSLIHIFLNIQVQRMQYALDPSIFTHPIFILIWNIHYRIQWNRRRVE